MKGPNRVASRIRARKIKGEKILRPVHPNAGITAAYAAKINAIVEEMHKSVVYWVAGAYNRAPPEMAQDELSARALRDAMRKLSKRWLARFDEAANHLADYFARAVSKRSEAALKKILKDGGISIDWKMTAAQRDIMQATISEQVNLIKSIPARYLSSVESSVMRAVQTGMDLHQLSEDLQKHFGVTKKRAAFISRDQNSKATASMTRARQMEIGITEAQWLHSGGGKHPRPTHLKAGRDKVRYPVVEGWFDPAIQERIFPGWLINCRCVSKPIVKGFS